MILFIDLIVQLLHCLCSILQCSKMLNSVNFRILFGYLLRQLMFFRLFCSSQFEILCIDASFLGVLAGRTIKYKVNISLETCIETNTNKCTPVSLEQTKQQDTNCTHAKIYTAIYSLQTCFLAAYSASSCFFCAC